MKKFLKIAFAIIFCSFLICLYACSKTDPPVTGLANMFLEFALPPSIDDCGYGSIPLTTTSFGSGKEKWNVEITIRGTTDGKSWKITKKSKDGNITLTSSPRGFPAFYIHGVPVHSGEIHVEVKFVSPCQTRHATNNPCSPHASWKVHLRAINAVGTPSSGLDLSGNVTIYLTDITKLSEEGC